jgi:hypothetical protein
MGALVATSDHRTMLEQARVLTDRWIGFWTQDLLTRAFAFYSSDSRCACDPFAFVTYVRVRHPLPLNGNVAPHPPSLSRTSVVAQCQA